MVVFLFLFWDQTTVMFQLSGFYCTIVEQVIRSYSHIGRVQLSIKYQIIQSSTVAYGKKQYYVVFLDIDNIVQ